MSAYISCHRIVKVYRVGGHELVALRGIDFEMDKGEFVAIIGPSGAGKSSLLNLLGGLDTPTAGQLMVDGQNLLELKGRALADYRLHRVGFVWQHVNRNPLSLRPWRSNRHTVTHRASAQRPKLHGHHGVRPKTHTSCSGVTKTLQSGAR